MSDGRFSEYLKKHLGIKTPKYKNSKHSASLNILIWLSTTQLVLIIKLKKDLNEKKKIKFIYSIGNKYETYLR